MALLGTVHYEVRDGVALLTIDNPPVNPLSSGVRFYLSKHLETALADAAVKAIVITGKGRAFIAGACEHPRAAPGAAEMGVLSDTPILQGSRPARPEPVSRAPDVRGRGPLPAPYDRPPS